jgi:2-amino-4-hydroxy-6-hydroxymethyldihydropteridine diphosphokinase
MGRVTRPVAIALGSNLGNRLAHLKRAIDGLRPALDAMRVSSFRDTEPVGTPGPQHRYLNAAIVGYSSLGPRAWLERLLSIEQESGRERPYRYARARSTST